MPLYPYRCEKGHATEKFRNMNDHHPSTVECETCGGEAFREYSKPTVVDDFPEHYNVSFGCVVKNRQHFRQLQREKGCHDWEPIKDSSLTEKQRKGGNW